MTVHVVSWRNYDESWIMGVFSSEELANEYMSKTDKPNKYGEFNLDSYEIDTEVT